MACSIKSKNNATKSILNLSEFSCSIFTYAIVYKVTLVKSTANHLVCKQGNSLHTLEFSDAS